jgi:hypothetical protein
MARAKIQSSPERPKSRSRGKRFKKETAEKLALVVHSLTLTPVDEDILERISRDASDYIGRTVSGSAIMRALLREVDRQGYQWVLSQLCPLVEAELASGVMWGRKKSVNISSKGSKNSGSS